MSDVAADIRDILVFHLGADEARLADDSRLIEDLGADRLDLVEIAMSCEEKFDIDIPSDVAGRLATVGELVRLVRAPVVPAVDPAPDRRTGRPPLKRLIGQALRSCLRVARRRPAIRDVFGGTSPTVSSH